MSLPNNLQNIYEKLNKGELISDNHIGKENAQMYNRLEQNFEEFRNYFQPIGIELVKGNGYFYFAKPQTKQQLENKISQAFRWIDLLDFFKTFNPEFGTGFRFTISQVAESIRVEAGLEEKLEKLSQYTRTKNAPVTDEIRSLVRQLQESGPFVQIENEISETYKVLSSIRYLEELMLKIEITDYEQETL